MVFRDNYHVLICFFVILVTLIESIRTILRPFLIHLFIVGFYDMSFFDEFDKNGGWGDDPRDPHEIADELHDSRYNRDRTVEPW